ncbi:hypothetical protein ACFLT7_06765 [candidate division KSB1 bacterium]
MSQYAYDQITERDCDFKPLFRIGGVAALVQLACLLVIMGLTITFGEKLTTAAEHINSLQENRVIGFLRGDFLTLSLIFPYLLTLPALYIALRRTHSTFTILAMIFGLVGVTTCFATNSGLSLLYLSDLYTAATSDALRTQYMAATEAVIASDMWNSSGAFISGILLQGAGVLLSWVMLQSRDFSKVTAYAGLLANGFDLIQHLLHHFLPQLSQILLMIAGPFYVVWFLMLGLDLFRRGRNESGIQKTPANK